MENGGVQQLSPDMVVVPLSLWRKLENLAPELEKMRERINLLEESSVTKSDYLTRQQAMIFLHVSSTKLWQIKNAGDIETSEATGKVLYKTSSCREYLASQGVSAELIQARFREILQAKKKK